MNDDLTQKLVDIVAEKIKKKREDSDWSQDDFALFAQMTRPYYSAIESAKYNFSLSKLFVIARYLDVEPGELCPSLEDLKKIIVDEESESLKSIMLKKQQIRREKKKSKSR